ncbi:MAG: hypothetical protein ACK4NO_03620 [Glycocaulis sp.]
MIDWQAWAIFAGALINAGAILGAALLATGTIRRAIDSRAGIRKAEVAEEALTLYHQALDVFASIRHPFSPAQESTVEGVIERQIDVIKTRLERNEYFFDSCRNIYPKIKAMHSESASRNFFTIFAVRNEIVAGASSLFFYDKETSDKMRSNEIYLEIIRTLYSSGSADSISQRLSDGLKELEKELLPLVRGSESGKKP